MSDCKGIITEIQRFSVHDGPGIRTLVFLKGCPLRCQWCSNPETQEKECQTLTRQGKVETVGKEVTVKTIIHEVLKDNIYYRRSGGGITLSGGEPLFQPDFAKALLHGCKDTGINTAIETTGFAGYEVIESMIPFLDLVMYDVKHISSEKHRLFTGRSNSLILSNLEKLAQTGVPIIVRVPVVPTFNSTPEEMTAIASYVAKIKGIKALHLLPYHRLGESKYAELGRTYDFALMEPLQHEAMTKLLDIVKRSGLHCQIGG